MFSERPVSSDEANAALGEIQEFIQRGFPDVACFMTTIRKDGQPSMRQVGSFVTGWSVETATQPWHVKNWHIRRNPSVTYLFVELTATPYRMARNVMLQGTCEIIEDPAALADFDIRRVARTGRSLPGTIHERWLLKTTPTYMRAEGFTGPRSPVILTEFPS